MTSRTLWSILVAGLLATGCYFETIDDRVPQAGLDERDGGQDENCERRFSTGCVIGVMKGPSLDIEDEEFHNAEQFAVRFSNLVPVERLRRLETLEMNPDREYQVMLLTELTVKNFTRGFEAFLNGEEAQTDSVDRHGHFNFHDIAPGIYDLRVQRSLKFAVMPIQLADETEMLEQPREMCAWLYADEELRIRRGEKTSIRIEELALEISDQECH